LVGLSLAKRHPEMLYAYVGMGQIVNGRANEVASYAQTLRLAEQANNTEALNELKLLAPYPEADGSVPLDKLGTERKWVMFFGGLTYGRKDWSYYERLFQFSPAYTSADVAAVDKGSALSLPRLFPDLLQFDVSGVTQWQCPIVLVLGRHDLTTPSTVAAEWFGKIRAPKKKLVWFENSAHMMMVEEPGYMLVHLVQDVRPLAR
jgi:pimeloyl-ACP methyl ester carboxylesterase